MATMEEQLNALHELHWLHMQAKLWGAARRFEYAAEDVERSRKERQDLKRELAGAHIRVSERIREVQKRLLATGYPVPDAWLTVRAAGQVSSWHAAAKKGKPETAVLMDTGADLPALETVCREMSVAILRLEAQTGVQAPKISIIEVAQRPRLVLVRAILPRMS